MNITQKKSFSKSKNSSHELPKPFIDYKEKKMWLASDENKKPISPVTGNGKGWNQDDAWGTYAVLEKHLESNPNHIPAIALSKKCELVAFDLDNAIDSKGKILPWAQNIIDRLAGAYVEKSSSNKGFHIFAMGVKPGPRISKSYPDNGKLEIYDANKAIRLTGQQCSPCDQLIDLSPIIADIYHALFSEKNEEQDKSTYKKSPPLKDEEIIELCRKAKNSAKFISLFDKGDVSEHNDDESAADLSLCSLLAFYTQNLAQIDRIFRRSKLFRLKWERTDYRESTMKKPLETLIKTYQGHNSEVDKNISKTSINTGLCIEEPFPIDVLPTVLRDIVTTISTDADSDPAISGTAAQSLAATALRRCVRVIEKANPYIQHYTTFFHTVVGESAQSRKSSNTKPLLRVFEKYHKKAKDKYDKQFRVYANAKDLAKKEKEEIKKDSSKSIEDRAKTLAEIDTTIEELKPKYYRLFTTDTTGPAFIMRLNETDGYYGIFTTDGGDLIDFIIGTPQSGTNDIIFVKLVTNDDIQVDRVGPDRRGISIDIPEPCGNVFIMTQEERWIRFNTHPRLRGSGLLGRNNPAIIPPRAKGYIEHEQENKQTTQMELQAWEELVEMFLNFRGEITLKLSKEAQKERMLLNNKFQETVGVDQPNYDVSDIVHRTVSECVKRAALFHVCDHYRNLKNIPDEIPLQTFNRAIVMQMYYLQQAINARRGDIGKAAAMELTAFLSKWIRRADQKEETFTDYIRASDLGKYFNTPPSKVKEFLHKLEEADVVKELPAEGKKASRYILNTERAKLFIGVSNEHR
jgi:hypothetical protein